MRKEVCVKVSGYPSLCEYESVYESLFGVLCVSLYGVYECVGVSVHVLKPSDIHLRGQ